MAILRNQRLNSAALILGGLWMIFFSAYTTIARLAIQVDGTVISSVSTSGPRYATRYTVRKSNGQTQEYVAGPTDSDLPRSMPMGTTIRKAKYELCYTRNGQQVCDFSRAFYATPFIFAALLLWIGVRAKWEERARTKRNL